MTLALRTAAQRALAQLAVQGYEPDRIILDGKFDYIGRPDLVRTVVKADVSVLAVAAASCVAKVTRDAIMAEEAEHYPPYDFESNVGYPAPLHQCALRGVRAERDPSPLVDLHGRALLARRSPGTRPALRVASRPPTREEGGHGRSTGGARAGARRDPAARRRCRRRPVGLAVALRGLGRPGPAEPRHQRQLLGRAARRRADDRGGRRPPRRGPPRRRPAGGLRGVRGRGRGRVPGAGAMDAPVAVSYGPVPGSVYCGHRFIDVLIHGWDLARATGQDATLPSDLVEACFEVVEPQRQLLEGSGMFGTVQHVGGDADRQTQLLAILGRHD